MPGRGAWPFYYKLGLDRRKDPQGRDAHGIYALKKELVFNGYAAGIVVDLPFWGKSVDEQTRNFQKDKGLLVDGELGPKTALLLFHKRAVALERKYGIPGSRLCKLKTHESANDPVAEGYADPDDEGHVQINLHYHPSITYKQAWDPAFAIDWAARYLLDAFNYIKRELGTGDWDGALASYNIGRRPAKDWVAAGKPASGGPMIGGQDGWACATKYVSLVKSAGC